MSAHADVAAGEPVADLVHASLAAERAALEAAIAEAGRRGRRVAVLEEMAQLAGQLSAPTPDGVVKDPGATEPLPPAPTRAALPPAPRRDPSAPRPGQGHDTRILEALHIRGDAGATRADLVTLLDICPRSATRALRRLIAQGVVRDEGKTRGRRFFVVDGAGEGRPRPSSAAVPVAEPGAERGKPAGASLPSNAVATAALAAAGVDTAPGDVDRQVLSGIVKTLNAVTEPVTARNVANHIGRGFDDVATLLERLAARGKIAKTMIAGVPHYARPSA